MVFVTVGEDKCPYFFFVFPDICEIRNYQVNTRHIIIREHETCIYNQEVRAMFYYHHIKPDLSQSSERYYFQHLFSLCIRPPKDVMRHPNDGVGAVVQLFF